jgi:Rps23 Pro-64 3,4-dihydroxylase Tpa1-like proline 4-hydroxylase
MLIRPLDREALRRQFSSATPFPFVAIDNFLDPGFAEEVARAYPSYELATQQGRTFKTVNEKKKVQITNAELFPEPIRRLNQALAAPSLRADLSYITGVPKLLADAELRGGGIHITGPGGRLDVHVDFNYFDDTKLYRRANLIVYLNPRWEKHWGGKLQLWDREVTRCEHEFEPLFNRCVLFEISDTGFHGVTPVSDEAPFPRQSFAVYYYTVEAPPAWAGVHDSIFRARPDEKVKGYVLMPAEAMGRKLRYGARRMKSGIKRLLGVSSFRGLLQKY